MAGSIALKRSRASSSHDANKFVSVAASNRYKTLLLEKVPIGERGFNIPKGSFHYFDQEFNKKGWGEFYKQSLATILPLVCEFYANAYEHQGSARK